nr:phage tail protein [Salmonella enterica]
MLGIFPLYKGNKEELSANDIIKDAPVLCVLDNTKTYFSVLNPLEIYLGSRYLQKNQNLADVPDKALARQSLQLGNSATRNVGTTPDTVAAGDDSRITGAMQKNQNGADIPDKAAFIEHIGMKETINPTKRVSIGNIGNGAFDGSMPCINIGDSDSGFIGSADGVIDIYCNNGKVGYIDSSGIHLKDQGLHIGDARMGSDGNVWGTRWNASGQWLWDAIVEQLNTRGTIDWINSQLAIRDNNINARATIDYVNQTFARKNTASMQDWGWILDESTGFIMQWGTLGSSNGTYNFPREFPASCFAVFVTNNNQQGGAVDNAFGYPVSKSQFFAATKDSSSSNHINNYPVAWFAIGR